MRKIFSAALLLAFVGFFFAQAVFSKDGSGYRGFVVEQSRHFSDAGCTVVELEHTKTGAKVLHVQTDDPENFFALCFRTHPTQSHGVAHIVEHTVLQGSQKFPINNVFSHMDKRTLATFMNAFTGADYTCYPASTLCEDDFYNLLDVYSDAVFHPLLTKMAFAQEGHRLEFETFDDPSTPLAYKGVVYNEMKGHLSSSAVRLMRLANSALFPDAAGQVFAGGDPERIPDLTYEEFIQFHKDHYYPGNCLFFFYGNLPLEKHLDFLADTVLLQQEKRAQVEKRSLQPYFSEPRFVEALYPASDDAQDKTIVGINWLTKEAPGDAMALRVLDQVLMATDVSPLKDALLQSGLCRAADSGLYINRPQIPYLLYIDGCSADSAKKIDAFVLATLSKIAQEGIPQAAVERAIAKIEFDEHERRAGKGPFGLQLLQSCVIGKLYGLDVADSFTCSEQLSQVKANLAANPHYLNTLIKKHFIDNPHRVCVQLEPSTTLAQEEQAREKEKLKAIQDRLTCDEIAAIISQSRELKLSQIPPSVEALACLPTIGLENIAKEVPEFPIQKESLGDLEVFYHPSTTGNIVYASLEFPLGALSQDELWQVGLYSYLLNQLGSNERSYRDALQFIDEYTGGISADIAMRSTPKGSYPVLSISGKALKANVEVLFDLFYDTITSADFTDKSRIRQLLIKHVNEVESSVKQNALEYASMASLAAHSIENHLRNSWEGLEYCEHILSLGQNLDAELDSLLTALQNLQKRMLPVSKAHLILSCTESAYKDCQKVRFGKLHALNNAKGILWSPEHYTLAEPRHAAYHIPTSVAFNARGFVTVSYSHPDSAYVLLAAELASGEYLHRSVREVGGAYGAGIRYEPKTGNFCFRTYRDPNIASSNEAFGRAIEQLVAGEFSEADVQKATLSMLQQVDVPLKPYQKPFIAYQLLCEERSDDERKNFRHKLLTASASDIQRVAFEHLACGFNQSVLLTLASKDLVQQENKKLVTPLLSYEASQCK